MGNNKWLSLLVNVRRVSVRGIMRAGLEHFGALKKRVTLEGFFRVIAWLLIGAATVAIAYPLVAPAVPFKPIETGLSAGVLIALAAQLFAQAKNQSDAAEKRSQFYLDSCVKAFEEARELLEDGNNDRPTWIAAGRALRHADQLAGSVSDDAHLRVLELHRLRYRRFFHETLHERTPAFFYGVSPDMSIEEAAKQSTASDSRTVSTLKELSDKSLKAIWQAAQWPGDYADPLDSGFTDAERSRLRVLFPGLHDFLEHKRRWRSVAGRLFERTESR